MERQVELPGQESSDQSDEEDSEDEESETDEINSLHQDSANGEGDTPKNLVIFDESTHISDFLSAIGLGFL